MTFQRIVILTFRLNVLFAVHLKRKEKKRTRLRLVEMRPVSQLGAGHKLWIGCCCEMLFWPVRCCFGHCMCQVSVLLASNLLFGPFCMLF